MPLFRPEVTDSGIIKYPLIQITEYQTKQQVYIVLAKQGVFQDGKIEITERLNDVPINARVVVIFLENDSTDEDALNLAKLQESTGFSQNVLANPAVDVWNDL